MLSVRFPTKEWNRVLHMPGTKTTGISEARAYNVRKPRNNRPRRFNIRSGIMADMLAMEILHPPQTLNIFTHQTTDFVFRGSKRIPVDTTMITRFR